MSTPDRVTFAAPSIGEDDIADVVATLRSGWLAAGPRVAAFEAEFARFTGAPHAVATSSCTGALHLALVGLGLGPGDEVIVPAMTFAATALAVVHTGARPVLADVEADTLCLDPEDVARRITSRTRAIVPVHYAGRPARVDEIVELAGRSNARVLEDCAHAVACWSGERHAGTIGDGGAFSFYANKNLTTIEGGMLITRHADVAARARLLRLQGITRDAWKREEGASQPWRYDVADAGFKYPMSDVQAALGLRQLSKLPGWQEHRRSLALRYRERLASVPGVTPLSDAPAGSRHANHLFVVRVDRDVAGIDRDGMASRLRAQGIETSVHYVPLHHHSYFQRTLGCRPGDFPRADAAFEQILSLPLHASLALSQVDRVCDAIAGSRP